jgi:threonylcarbamoyladenosine tRNA methylthiotransferase MtaB
LTVEEGWSSSRTVALQTVGCKLNQAETESLTRRFLEAGYRLGSPDSADIYVLNTCTVTHVADRKCRKLLRAARRSNPDRLIAAIGCYAERAADELRATTGVGLVVARSARGRLVELVGSATNGQRASTRPSESVDLGGHVRAMVSIQEGCSQPCSFCVVPTVRGPERSRPAEDVVADVRSRVAEGHKEVILTGTRIGRYAHDGGLRGLTARVLSDCGVQRLRLSSLEPADLTPDLLQLWEDPRLCPHIHMPLQSGSDDVLQRMRRAYSTARYEQAASTAREAIPDLALTTDVMVGFPGEGGAEFTQSHEFCRRMAFAAMHVFPYSARPGTTAQQMGDGVEEGERKQRVRVMLDLARENSRRFRERFLGRIAIVLCEGRKDGASSGLTDNYMRVFFSGDDPPTNEFASTRLEALREDGFWGTIQSLEA